MATEPALTTIGTGALRTQMLIDGKWRAAADGRTFAVHDPATGREIAQVPQAGAADVDAAVQAARRALSSAQWRDLTPVARERLLLKLADLIEQHQEDLARIETLNQGKSLALARGVDVARSAQWFRYMAGWATKIEGSAVNISFARSPGTKYQTIVKRDPVGVVGAIVPWNFPLLMAVWKLAPALACGCTVILKPAEETPLSALRLAELVLEAGFPDGVVNIITGDGDTGAELVRHAGVDKITFTGSTEVGRLIGQQCGADIRRVTLELGGKSPVIVLDDCDLDLAIRGASGAILYNCGQVCTAGSRLYVPKKSFERVAAGVAAVAKESVLGSGFDPNTQIGPLVSERHRAKVVRLIESGKQEGAELLSGGSVPQREGYFVQPTVFANSAKRPLTLLREEVFGPVLVAEPYTDLEEVIALANDTTYGLAASVWTSNLSKALRVSERIDAGTVWINAHGVVDPNMPFGGFKQSGIGREHGRAAIDSYTEIKTVCIAY